MCRARYTRAWHDPILSPTLRLGTDIALSLIILIGLTLLSGLVYFAQYLVKISVRKSLIRIHKHGNE